MRSDLDESSEDELLDLLTCHRSATWIQTVSQKKVGLKSLEFQNCFPIAEASLGPYAWERPSADAHQNRKVADGQPLHPMKDSQKNLEVNHVVGGYHLPPCDEFLLHDDLKLLSRSWDVFGKISMDPCMSYSLPKPGCTAGRVLEHSIVSINRFLEKYSPMTFKLGITHDAHHRWYCPTYGYKHSKDRFDRLHVVYASSNPYSPAMLEAALIDRFKSHLVAFLVEMGVYNIYILYNIVYVLEYSTWLVCARMSACVCVGGRVGICGLHWGRDHCTIISFFFVSQASPKVSEDARMC